MEIPAGYGVQDGQLTFTGEANRNSDKLMSFLRIMYELKQTGHNWYNTLTEELLKVGFCQSKVDKCLFIHSCVVIVYVDDCLLFSHSDQVLDDMIELLNKNFKITSSNSIQTYLGLKVTRNQEENTITLRQTGLIDKVIRLCGLEDESNEHLTPADKILQQSDGVDAPRQHQWSYHQVIGILNYIAATS
jgi:hypothetical protein